MPAGSLPSESCENGAKLIYALRYIHALRINTPNNVLIAQQSNPDAGVVLPSSVAAAILIAAETQLTNAISALGITPPVL